MGKLARMHQGPPPLPVKKSRTGLYVLRAFLGLGLCGFAGWGFTKAAGRITQIQKQKQETQELLASLKKENVDNLRKVVESGDGVSEGAAYLDTVQQKIGTIADKMPAQEKRIMLAGQDVLAEFQAPFKTYQAAYAELLKSNSFNPVGLTTLDDLHKRRAQIQLFCDANAKLTAAFSSMEERFRSRMKARGANATQIEAAAKGFLESSHADIVALVREDDRLLGLRMLEAMDLFEQHWGQWKLNEQEQLIFDKDSDLQRYNALEADITAIAKHQEEMQQKMLATQEKK